jgi:signal transduction histidine kinase
MVTRNVTEEIALTGKVVDLISLREPQALANEALSFLVSEFGATAGSIFYPRRPSLCIRKGMRTDATHDHIQKWERNLEQRLGSGPWQVAPDQKELLATQRVPGTDQVAIHSLLQDGTSVTGSVCLVFTRDTVPSGRERTPLTLALKAVNSAYCLTDEMASTKERLSQLSLFYQVAQSMASTFDVDKVLNDTIQLATAILDASVAVLMMVDEESNELVYEYAYGEMGGALRKQRVALDEGIAAWAASYKTPVIVNDVLKDPRYDSKVDARTGFVTESVACAPIQIRGETIGVLEALNKRGGMGFDAEDLSLMVTTANQAAVAIENARLYQSLREERDRIIQIQENTRRQVARNLHDGTVQFLSAISMGIDHLERLLELKPEVARSELAALRDLTRQATQQARLALFELRPLILETQGLVPALEAYVEQLAGNEDFSISLETEKDLPQIEQSVAATIFAIIQEAVNNVKKHAGARDVWLRLRRDGHLLKVICEDNGKGFEPEIVNKEYDRRGSIGLLTMRERADLIDGQLTIESNTTPPAVGTRITLEVPISTA